MEKWVRRQVKVTRGKRKARDHQEEERMLYIIYIEVKLVCEYGRDLAASEQWPIADCFVSDDELYAT